MFVASRGSSSFTLTIDTRNRNRDDLPGNFCHKFSVRLFQGWNDEKLQRSCHRVETDAVVVAVVAVDVASPRRPVTGSAVKMTRTA